jgi:hypothetical protein
MKRKPVQFTPAALAAFRRLKRAERACICDDGECRACRRWWDAHRVIHTETGAQLWQFPCVCNPTHKGGTPEAYALWRELEAELQRASRR